MKTLRVTLADIIGPTGTPNSTATVHARYVDTSGRGRDVHLTDGTIVVPVRRTVAPGTVPQHFDFDVYANDAAPVREVDYGHLVEVSWTVVAPTGAKSSGVKRVQITDSMASVVQLGLLSTPTPVPPYTGGYVTPETYAALVARVVELEDAPGGGGSGGTLTADDTPAAPAEGESATYFVTDAVVWPDDLVWSTDPDGGVEPTITDAALVSMFTLDGTTYAVLGSTFPAPPDVTAPTTGALAGSAITSAGFTLTVTDAADAESGLSDFGPYSFSTDDGATWTDWQNVAFLAITGLTPETDYLCKHRVRDNAGNIAEGATITVTTGATPVDETGPTVGTRTPSSVTSSGFTLTVTGASDETALHATPYAFTTNGGSSWSAYQSSAVYVATGLTAETGYSTNHRVRDAAGNVSTATAATVTTGAASTPAVEFVASASNASDATSHTFPGVSFGAPAAGRQIIVALAYTHGNLTVPTITIGGVAATIDQARIGIVGSVGRAIIARAAVPTGTTGDVVVTYGATVYRAGIGVYRASAAVTALAATVVGDDGSIAIATATITNPSGGTVVASAIAIYTALAWTGAMQDYVAEPDPDVRVTSASTATTGALTIKATSTGGQYDSIAAVAYTAA